MTGKRAFVAVSAVLLMMVGGLFATGGVASASASATITNGYLLSNGDLHLFGTAACSTQSGTADLRVNGFQFLPFVHGWTIISIDCAAGLVPWAVDLTPGFGPYRSPAIVSVNAQVVRSGVIEAGYVGTLDI